MINVGSVLQPVTGIATMIMQKASERLVPLGIMGPVMGTLENLPNIKTTWYRGPRDIIGCQEVSASQIACDESDTVLGCA